MDRSTRTQLFGFVSRQQVTDFVALD